MRVRLTLAPDDVVELDIDFDAATFRERHDVARAIGRLTDRDAAGNPVAVADEDDQLLAWAWVVLRRERPELKFSDLFDVVTPQTFERLGVDGARQDVNSPEA